MCRQYWYQSNWITPAVTNAKSTYAIVTVYESLDGKAEVTEIVDFNSGNWLF